MQEIRWPGEGSQRPGNFTLFYGGTKTPPLGTGFLFRNRILSAVKDVRFIGDRISYAILKCGRYDLIIINVHNLTQDKDDEVKVEFYRP